MNTAKDIYHEASELAAIDKIRLVDLLLQDIQLISPEIDSAWAKESEDRINAYENSEIKSIPADEVFAKYAR